MDDVETTKFIVKCIYLLCFKFTIYNYLKILVSTFF